MMGQFVKNNQNDREVIINLLFKDIAKYVNFGTIE